MFLMIKEGYISLVSTSGRDTDMIKFCGLTIMCLSKKFKKFKIELTKAKEECANANEKHLATKFAATRL